MNVIENLDSVLAAIDALKIEAREGGDLRVYPRMANSVERACYDHLRDHGPAIRQDMIDARRYRMLRDEATSEQIAAFVARRRTRLAADRVCDAAIDARLASDSEGGE